MSTKTALSLRDSSTCCSILAVYRNTACATFLQQLLNETYTFRVESQFSFLTPCDSKPDDVVAERQDVADAARRPQGARDVVPVASTNYNIRLIRFSINGNHNFHF